VGSIDQPAAALKSVGATRVALAADSGVKAVGLLDTLLAHLPEGLIGLTVLTDADPGAADVDAAAAQVRESGADAVLVFGGGSALAVGKGSAVLAPNDGKLLDYIGKTEVPNAPLPTVAIPTTAGSGAEVSKTFIVHEQSLPVEVAIRVEANTPRVAILDGGLLRRAPRNVLVYSALDALTHSLESLWAKRANYYTTALGKVSAQAVIDNLPLALDGLDSGANAAGRNDAVLQTLMDASCASNYACGNSALGLVHAMAAAPSVHLPHGLRNGILLPYVAAFNHDLMLPEGREIAAQLEGFYARIGFEAKFPPGTVGEAGIEAQVVASTGHPFRANNVREASDDDLRAILREAGALA
jgi:alcohol dehydrogenase class IV